eukprot:TRINITY_DN3698_c0_g1_i2.p1 TRINITY_DN3698_c0_g1~~TRINITY_DN3698_c0_g1_i2.p1  ORF type:complete len:214 (-),score=16.10 TRINITY_DN3698_c0_g1_i2:17-658(-)
MDDIRDNDVLRLEQKTTFDKLISDPYFDITSMRRPTYNKGKLDLTSKIFSVKARALKNIREETIFVDELEKFCEKSGLPLVDITHVILACNSLTDEDVPHIASFIEKLPNCECVVITNNRICGLGEKKYLVDDAIIKMLLQPSVKYLAVYGNIIATIGRKDLYQNLVAQHPKLLSKLIWISKLWLDTSGWRTMIQDAELEHTILDTHRQNLNN